MTRRKGERTAAVIERELPHHVLIVVPDDGGQAMWDMPRLCAFLGGEAGRSMPGRVQQQRYCFPSPEKAADFARRARDAGIEVLAAK